ncbi:hypothetical protein K438DRAFT_2011953 [Mycena galopus ATCC 62051]|nr:hypothetical protein K438DRAFT_2011953 [Mycena galopus ATCC 62051]
MEREGIITPQTSAEERWAYLQDLGKRTELREPKLFQEIKILNSQYIDLSWLLDHLRARRQTNHGQKAHDPDFEIVGITHALGEPDSDDRKAQFAFLREQYYIRLRRHANPDPFHLLPFGMEPFGIEMQKWFYKRRNGVRFSNSACTFGSDESSSARALATQVKFAQNTAAQSLGGHRSTAILCEKKGETVAHCVRQLADWQNFTLGVHPDTGSCLGEGWRWAICDDCHDVVIANFGNSQHECQIFQDKKPVLDVNFPSLKLLRYLHNVFEEPELAAQLDIGFEHFELVRVPVRDVLSRPQNTELVAKELPGLDLASTGELYVYRCAKNEVKTEWLEATLAVDTSLHLVSTCPLELSPTLAPRGDAKLLCLHTCRRTRNLLESDPTMNIKSNVAGGPRNCGTELVHRISTLFDLPSVYLGARWFTKHVVPELNLDGSSRRASKGGSGTGKNADGKKAKKADSSGGAGVMSGSGKNTAKGGSKGGSGTGKNADGKKAKKADSSGGAGVMSGSGKNAAKGGVDGA